MNASSTLYGADRLIAARGNISEMPRVEEEKERASETIKSPTREKGRGGCVGFHSEGFVF